MSQIQRLEDEHLSDSSAAYNVSDIVKANSVFHVRFHQLK